MSSSRNSSSEPSLPRFAFWSLINLYRDCARRLGAVPWVIGHVSVVKRIVPDKGRGTWNLHEIYVTTEKHRHKTRKLNRNPGSWYSRIPVLKAKSVSRKFCVSNTPEVWEVSSVFGLTNLIQPQTSSPTRTFHLQTRASENNFYSKSCLKKSPPKSKHKFSEVSFESVSVWLRRCMSEHSDCLRIKFVARHIWVSGAWHLEILPNLSRDQFETRFPVCSPTLLRNLAHFC